MKTKVSIVGSGIIGLAHALAFAKEGFEVSVFERHAHPIGASIRNFGLFWALGQEPEYLPIVHRSRTIWQELLKAIDLPIKNHGTLVLAYSEEEYDLLKSFLENEADLRPGLDLLNPRTIVKENLLVNPDHLIGGLRSTTEFSFNPRKAIPGIIKLLQTKYGVNFYFNTPIQFTAGNYLASEYQSWESDITVICNGDDFETLYPEEMRMACLEKCHLQMMKARTHNFIQLGAILCSGLSLLHYPSFSKYPELKPVIDLSKNLYPEYLDHGIHVMITQNSDGDLIIGDSHTYDDMPQPFNLEHINNLILKYLKKYCSMPSFDITERWTGTYSLHSEEKHYFSKIEENVWISTGFGGSGMTLGFGQAEQNMEIILNSYRKDEKIQNYPLAF